MIAHQEEHGSGTVLTLAAIAALMMLIGVVHVVGAAAVAAAQAARGADLAALAAADSARGLTTGDPCTVADDVATRNGVMLRHCVITGDHGTEAVVEVVVPVLPKLLGPGAEPPGSAGGGWEAVGSARAGPPADAWG